MSRGSEHKNCRRNLSVAKASAMALTDLNENFNREGWPYPDCDDDETTERFTTPFGIRDSGRRVVIRRGSDAI